MNCWYDIRIKILICGSNYVCSLNTKYHKLATHGTDGRLFTTDISAKLKVT